jgi:hypothetical protein
MRLSWTSPLQRMLPLRRMATEEDGGILVETAFVMPILIAMLLGSVELGRYLIAHQKLERAASSVADLVSQSPDTVTMDEIETLFGIVPHITAPYDVEASGRVILTAVTRSEDEDDDPMVAWQVDGMGALNVESQIGDPDEAATLPAEFVVLPGETVIIAEAWYDYEAYFFEEIDPTGPIYHRALYRPRLSSLSAEPQ